MNIRHIREIIIWGLVWSLEFKNWSLEFGDWYIVFTLVTILCPDYYLTRVHIVVDRHFVSRTHKNRLVCAGKTTKY